ncbi:MAG: acyl-CoA carboxylase subunit epsilon [Jatrophihabitantaceae bacterium]
MNEQGGPAGLRIVRGEPTAEELAAVTAVVTAASGAGAPDPEPPRRGRWTDPAWQHLRMPRPGAGAWTAALR